MNVGDTVFLSASVPTRSPWIANARPTEIEEAIISVARATFARRGRLIFGGHPSVSPLVAAVAGEYFKLDPDRERRPIVIFQSRLFEKVLPDETHMMARMGWASIEWSDRLPLSDDVDDHIAAMRSSMLPADGPGDPHKRHGLCPPVAMFAIGGMEGVIDEAVRFLDAGDALGAAAPVFYLPSTGGAAASLRYPQQLRDIPTLDNVDVDLLDDARLINAEATWRAHTAVDLPDDLPFQPYAAIVQSLLGTPSDVNERGTRDRY